MVEPCPLQKYLAEHSITQAECSRGTGITPQKLTDVFHCRKTGFSEGELVAIDEWTSHRVDPASMVRHYAKRQESLKAAQASARSKAGRARRIAS